MLFDEERGSLTLRIVYDGLGTAGKSTNVQQLHALYTVARASDVVVPAVSRGRTLYFDWLELDVGWVGDVPLRCQVLTVPGQFAYIARRWELVRAADGIVCVCDASPEGLPRSRLALETLARIEPSTEIPIVVQANKQDAPGALGQEELRAALAIDEDRRVVPAVAREGVGVRETFMVTLQAARERLRHRLAADGLANLPRGRESASDIYRWLTAAEEEAAEHPALAIVEG